MNRRFPWFFVWLMIFPGGLQALGDHNGHILEGHVIFKLSIEADMARQAQGAWPAFFMDFFSDKQVEPIQRVFPGHSPPVEKFHSSGMEMADLSRIFEVVISCEELQREFVRALRRSGLVDYVQFRPLPRPAIVDPPVHQPNDSLLDQQYYLRSIYALEAWAIAMGDTNTVIAIVDTGTDLYHPDLMDAIAYNYGDPVNGEDSDGDGYVDNYFGWNLGEDNNNPTYLAKAHGVHVSGISSATSNNGEGIAGTGYFSRFLPVKIDDEFGRLVKAYEGIVYAADMGASVINCSWGSHFNPGPFAQDVIDYAVLNRNAVVVAAAGNANNSAPFFPASCDRVISVAATDATDAKASFSSYGPHVDVLAPGDRILSTWVNASYMVSGGTSMAAPMVAGAAAIVRSYYPQLDALQVSGLLKVSSDPVDHLHDNLPYAGMLGFGRLNMFRALTLEDKPYVMIAEEGMNEYATNNLRPGEALTTWLELRNILSSNSSLKVHMSASSAHVNILNPLIELPSLPQGSVYSTQSDSFVMIAEDSLPLDHRVTFIVTVYDHLGDLVGKKAFDRVLNSSYVNVETSLLAATISSRGALGYNYPDFSQGLGFRLPGGYTLLKAGGIVLSVEGEGVLDNIYSAEQGRFSETLAPVSFPGLVNGHGSADLIVEGRLMQGDDSMDLPLMDISYQAYFWEGNNHESFLILDYSMVNTSLKTYREIWVGFFADWVLRDNKTIRAGFDGPSDMAYAYTYGGNPLAGIQLLEKGSGMRHYAFDNDGSGGSMRIDQGFSNFQKHQALTTNRLQAGGRNPGNDVSSLLSSGPHSLAPGDTLRVPFALHVFNKEDMRIQAVRAHERFLMLAAQETATEDSDQLSPLGWIEVWPNPFSGILHLRWLAAPGGDFSLEIVDMQGSIHKRLEGSGQSWEGGDQLSWSLGYLPAGIYFLRLRGDGFGQVLKVISRGDAGQEN